MNPSSFLSLRDYFNYYISGLIWCIDLLFVYLTISSKSNFSEFIVSINSFINPIGVILLGVLVVFIPYVLGFTLLPLSEYVRKKWQGKERYRYPDPREFILILKETYEDKEADYERKWRKFDKRHLSNKETMRIQNLANDLFDIEYKKAIHLYFYLIRAYVLEQGSKSSDLANRARDLANFTESLLIPVPLAFFSIGIYLIFTNYQPSPYNLLGLSIYYIQTGLIMFGSTIVLGGLSFGVHYLLVKRYFWLEEYWVKHVYRAFLVIRSIKNNEAENK